MPMSALQIWQPTGVLVCNLSQGYSQRKENVKPRILNNLDFRLILSEEDEGCSNQWCEQINDLGTTVISAFKPSAYVVAAEYAIQANCLHLRIQRLEKEMVKGLRGLIYEERLKTLKYHSSKKSGEIRP